MRLRWGREIPIGAVTEKGAGASLLSTHLWRTVGALVLGVLFAKWSWVLFAPHATAAAVMPERGVAVEAGRLFGVVVVAPPAPVEAVALPNVQLIGVFAAMAGKSSFAVLKVDGKQLGVAVGETVSAGTKLSEVHADHVLLERAGVQQRVNLEGRATASSGVVVVPALR